MSAPFFRLRLSFQPLLAALIAALHDLACHGLFVLPPAPTRVRGITSVMHCLTCAPTRVQLW